VHLGKRDKNTTREIIANLDKYFDNYTVGCQFRTLDLLFIAGDLFDSLLDLSGEDIYEIALWLDRLMSFCSRNKIKLRILEGTPSHDWAQSKISESIYAIKANDENFKLDFKYVSTLSIEHLRDLGLYILYVPDEWSHSAEDTQKQVEVLLKEKRLSQVDIAVMHGMFPHQLPGVIQSNQKHNPDYYLSIVKHYITIGHIHTFSVLDRIIAQGSFDRLSHGEEDPKGAVVVYLSKEGNDSFTFVENKNAKSFVTVELRRKDLDESIKKLEKVLSKLRDDSNIRIKAAKDHPVFVAFDELKNKYPNFHFVKKALDEEEDYVLVNNLVKIETAYTPITLTSDNIVEMTLQEIKNQNTYEEAQINTLKQMLTDLV
jgi:DNA repair exonuclease SbcCD nuclease subunit